MTFRTDDNCGDCVTWYMFSNCSGGWCSLHKQGTTFRDHCEQFARNRTVRPDAVPMHSCTTCKAFKRTSKNGGLCCFKSPDSGGWPRVTNGDVCFSDWRAAWGTYPGEV